MPDKKPTDNEIVKALECCLADKMICEECPIQDECESHPFEAILAKYSLDLINRLEAENENLKDILYDAEGVNLVNYWHQQCGIAKNGCKNFAEENKNLKAEIKRLKKSNRNWRRKVQRLRADNNELIYKLECLLCHSTGGKLSKHNYPLDTMECYVNDTIQEYCEEAEKEAKSEAYKEFAEELEGRIAVHLLKNKSNQYAEGFADALDGVNLTIDNLLKELIKELIGE